MVIRDTKKPFSYREVCRKTVQIFSFITVGVADFMKIQLINHNETVGGGKEHCSLCWG